MRLSVGELTLLVAGILMSGCGSDSGERDAAAITLQKGGFKESDEQFAKDRSIDDLAKLVKSKDVKVRMAALTALGYKRNDKSAAKTLLDVINGEAAAKALGGLDGNEAVANDLYFAIQSLARLGAPEAKGVIEKAYQSKNPYLREAAVQAIGLLGDKSLYPLLMKALDDPDVGVSVNADFVVKKYKVEEALEE